MDIREYARNFRENYLKKHGKYPKTIVFNLEQYKEALCCLELKKQHDKPKPPVKSETKTTERGTLWNKTTTTIEYDNDSPEYLKKLELWHKQVSKFYEDYPYGIFYGMKVLLKD